jgi:ProP effector
MRFNFSAAPELKFQICLVSISLESRKVEAETPTKSPHPYSREAAKSIIATLAQLFPRTFTAEQWEPHGPLAIGIGQQLIELGIITRAEGKALWYYTKRFKYLESIVFGVHRIGLDGEPAGVVDEDQAHQARKTLAGILALRDEDAKKAKAQRIAAAEARRAARIAELAKAAPKPEAPVAKPAAPHGHVVEQPAAPSGPRLGLAGLKAEALKRKSEKATA